MNNHMSAGKGMTPRKGYNPAKYREGYARIDWGRRNTFENRMSGKPIPEEEAYEGLGDPNTWEAQAKQLYAEFEKKPMKPLESSQPDIGCSDLGF